MTDAVVWRAEHCIHVHVCTRVNDCVDALTPCRAALHGCAVRTSRETHSMSVDVYCTAVLHTRAVKHTAERRWLTMSSSTPRRPFR